MNAEEESCSTRSSFTGLSLSVRKAVKETNATLSDRPVKDERVEQEYSSASISMFTM